VSDEVDLARLADLLDPVVAAARPACAPVFCGWRALPVPTSPKAHVVHQMNALRELRHGLHSAAVVAAGMSPHQALSINSPHMAPIFGWAELADVAGLQPTRDAVEDATNRAIAHAYEGLDDDGRDELVGLVGALVAGIS
jgi:hypothetical protein